MTQFLPPNLLALFAARDPIPYLPPASKLRHEKHPVGYTGVGAFLCHFEDPSETPPPMKVEKREERLERKRKDKAEQVAYKLEQAIATWNPNTNLGATLDPFRTLFVGRINYDTSESKLRREFDVYGPITKIQMVFNKKTGKPRGYAFVEYEHERDMHSAYKHADGKKIDGRRVLVDVERGRTVKGWLPRRLGGGLGGTRRGGPEVNVKISGREDPDRDRFRDEKSDRGRDREREGSRRDRSRDKDTERHRDRDRERDRDKDKDKERRRSRDRSDRGVERIERDRGDREERVERSAEDRERSRAERKRRRSRSRDKREKDGAPEEEEGRSRKRSKSRERKRHRSKSKDKDKKKDKRDKERGDRDRDRERDRKDKGKDRIKVEDMDFTRVRVKEEPVDDYPQFDNYTNYDGYNVKTEGEAREARDARDTRDANGEGNGDAEFVR